MHHCAKQGRATSTTWAEQSERRQLPGGKCRSACSIRRVVTLKAELGASVLAVEPEVAVDIRELPEVVD